MNPASFVPILQGHLYLSAVQHELYLKWQSYPRRFSDVATAKTMEQSQKDNKRAQAV